MREATPEQSQQFLLGLLHHLRQRGGILQPATENKADSFETVIRPDQRNSWSEDWTTRIFAAASLLLKDQLIESNRSV